MAKLLKLRRGTTTQHGSFTGAEGEVTIDTTKDTAVVHDGSTAGGRALAREDLNNVSSIARSKLANVDVVDDTTPQLGGNLDVQASEITTSTSNGNIKLNPNGTGVVEVKGDGSSADGTLQLNCSQNSHGVKIKSPAHSAAASYTLTLPTTDGNNHELLKSDGSGVLSWTTIGPDNIAADAITEPKIADNAVVTATILNGNVTTLKIADGAVTNAKLADDAVGIAEIADNAVRSQHINNDAVITAKITDANVTTAKIADEAITLAKLEHGTSSNNGKFLRANNGADPTFETVNTDLVADTTPQLGGNLASNNKNILIADENAGNNRLKIGDGPDLELYHQSGNSYVENATGELCIRSDDLDIEDKTNGHSMITAVADGPVELYYDNTKRIETTNIGGTVTGKITVSNGAEVTGAITSTTTISDSKGNLRDIPSNVTTSAYVATATDAGKAIYISTGGVTLNNSVFSAGHAVTIINNSGSAQTITQGSGVTMYNTGDATTGNRTLAGRGMATVWFAAANVAYISGSGLS